LRLIFKLAVIDEWERLFKLDSLYLEKVRVNGRPLTDSQSRRSTYLIHLRDYLERSFLSSICVCEKNGKLRGDVSGDRVRIYEITRLADGFGAIPTFLVKKNWYSLEYYNLSGNWNEDCRDDAFNLLIEERGDIFFAKEFYLGKSNV
jgi:hypothetical protein